MATTEPGSHPGREPVGEGDREVLPGECVISIAEAAGHFWKTLWDLPENRELKSVRKDPNVLLAGDRIHVPAIRPKQESGATDQRHTFVRRGVPSVLRLKCAHLDEPLANQPYTLEIDGRHFTGQTDAEGNLERSIPCGARTGRLRVGVEPNHHDYELNLGGLDPVETVTGQKARLNNLGYLAGQENAEATPEFQAAVRKFQEDQGMAVSGEMDDETRAKLKELTC
jgi:hypothetical protein